MINLQNQTIWPNATFNNLSLKKSLTLDRLLIKHHIIPKNAIQYIAYICHIKKYSISSFERCLSISANYLSKTSQNNNIQLILLTSLLLVTKILQTQNLTISELHELSNHCFTNKNIHQMEEKICELIQFAMLSDGLPSRKVKIILQMIKHTLPEHSHEYLDSISEDVQLMFWFQFYSKDFQLNNEFMFELIPVVIVQISLILMTQSNGSFPQVAWISTILGAKKEMLQELASKYLKKILGKQVSKSLFI